MRTAGKAGLRRVLLVVCIAAFIAGTTGTALAGDDYPNRPITIYLGMKIGATTGLTATVLGKILEDAWGQPVAIVDKSGASATIALGQITRLPADGYSLAVGAYSAILSAPYQYEVPFDPDKDIDPLYAYSLYHTGFAVKADSPWKTMKD